MIVGLCAAAVVAVSLVVSLVVFMKSSYCRQAGSETVLPGDATTIKVGDYDKLEEQ